VAHVWHEPNVGLFATAVWRNSPGSVYYYFPDMLGSTRVVTDSSGNVCFNADYYPYGQENDYNTSCEPTYKFAGMEFDSETGNYYDYARYYSPHLGRFMSPDPANAGADIGNPQSWNAYAYTLNNPTTFTDPTGLCPQGEVQNPSDSTCLQISIFELVEQLSPWGSGQQSLSPYQVHNPTVLAPTPYVLSRTWTSPQTPGRVTQVARCAASLANTMSVAHYAHLQSTPVASGILSNDFSSLTNLIFGPGRGTAAGGLTENLGTSPALQLTAKGAGTVPVDSGFQFLFSSVPATTFAETAVGGVADKALGTAAAALSFESVGQAIYDAGVYAGAVYVCAQ
jgi:RHS repeat-associated protein